MEEVVISLCDLTGNMVVPWAAAGYQCYCVDLRHPPGIGHDGNIVKVNADIHECASRWMPIGRRVRIAFGFPPCTHTAVSGAKWFQSKGPARAAESFALIARVDQLLRWFHCPFMWEQPVATTSTYCGKPAYTFDPHDYAGYLDDPSPEAYTKQTCLWTGNGFVMPERKSVEPVLGSKMHRIAPSEDRAHVRSATPRGFAEAVFQSNSRSRP
ncbi:MAG TPA: hypothetical protein VFE47_18410 [Tepidisphaeraceae bacterium]|jgi:hypothetical protein|nr:hypothetical protein [Tepidisphaeraceae bacterium]